MQSQKVSLVAGSVSCSYFTASLTRELPCLWAAEGWTGERDKTKAFASPWDYSDELPVGLAKASAASAALVGFFLCPVSPPHFLTGVSSESSHQRNFIFHLKLFPWNCPFISVIALRKVCIVVPLELLLLSFLHPVLFAFSFPIFSQ